MFRAVWNRVKGTVRAVAGKEDEREAPAPGTARPGGAASLVREVRLGLVMNGGVSLAVWIAGVTHEIDCIRRARVAAADELNTHPTTGMYRNLLEILRERVLVDVVAGASAGGINGSLLAAAIYAQEPLPRLRDVWLTVGDFSKLLRSPSQSQPPSLLRGDEFVLPQLEDRFREILGGGSGGPGHRLYLYVTGTDFHGLPETFADSTFRRFQELDHRRVFQFQHLPRDELAVFELTPVLAKAQELQRETRGGMPQVGAFDRDDAAVLLANAARSSSSFPVAFEAHGLEIQGQEARRWLIDGGILDNQPFNPVLNRIATIPGGDLPIRRVLGYVVPYVTEVSPPAVGTDGPPQPTARQTAAAASSLPRELPLLLDLERVRAELAARRRFERGQRHLEELERTAAAAAANALFESYCKTRFAESIQTFAHWDSPTFEPGFGELGQLEVTDADSVWAEEAPPANPGVLRTGLRWLPDEPVWSRGQDWHWGLAPSERIATDALDRLRQAMWADPDDPRVLEAKTTASQLVAKIRSLKFQTCVTFRASSAEATLVDRANEAYEPVVEELTRDFTTLGDQLDKLAAPQPGRLDVLPLQRLIDAEVLQNALSIDRSTPPAKYDFIHMSAGIRNALDHPDRSPETKLAGMKLNHFAGFLKQSWRASDWLWGRLDGVQYLVACILDLDLLPKLSPGARDQLADFAFPSDRGDTLSWAWARTFASLSSEDGPYAALRGEISPLLEPLEALGPTAQFAELLAKSSDESVAKVQVRSALLDCCRTALAARIQLDVLAEELEEVQQAVEADLDAGASRASSGAEWARRPTGETDVERVERFRQLRIGKEESPLDEASSKLGMEVGSTGMAVAAAAFSGAKGGLPAVVRAQLASVRGLTLVLSIFVRMLVRTPTVGIAAVIATAVAVVWALVSPNTVLGAALPGLAAVTIGGVVVLLTMATSPLEERCRGVKLGLGLLFLVALPPALVVFVLGFPFAFHDELSIGGASSWLARRTVRTAVDIAGCFALAAFAAAIVRFLAGWLSRKLRVVDLWVYRWSLLLAAATIGGGAAYNHSQGTSSRSWNGVVLFLILFGAISLAPLVAAVVEGGQVAYRRIVRRLRPR